MTRIPRDPAWDSTLAFLAEGYTFVSSRCRRLQSDRFETRLMLRPAVCVLGEDAAKMFSAPDRFTRRGRLPITTLMALQDFDSVQVLDGEAFRWRKEIFLALMTRAVRLLTAMEYEAPPQDFSIDLSKFLVVPKSRFVITDVRVGEPAPVPAMSPVG